MKIFFDTHVLAAAFATRGLCGDLCAHVLLEHELVLVTGDAAVLKLGARAGTRLPLVVGSMVHSRP